MFSTAHSTKGQEADYVVVLDLRDNRYGFPCRVEDDPLLGIVMPPIHGDPYPFAEERRLLLGDLHFGHTRFRQILSRPIPCER